MRTSARSPMRSMRADSRAGATCGRPHRRTRSGAARRGRRGPRRDRKPGREFLRRRGRAGVLGRASPGCRAWSRYKAVNTADSMVGHRTPRHEAFGWASARLDDLVNLPASRLAALWLLLAAALAGADPAGRVAAPSAATRGITARRMRAGRRRLWRARSVCGWRGRASMGACWSRTRGWATAAPRPTAADLRRALAAVPDRLRVQLATLIALARPHLRQAEQAVDVHVPPRGGRRARRAPPRPPPRGIAAGRCRADPAQQRARAGASAANRPCT